MLPDGIEDIRDCPYNIFNAIQLALMFLQYEELPEEEQPPRAIWFNERALQDHFEAVRRNREEKYKGESKDIDDPVQNDAAKGLIVGR